MYHVTYHTLERVLSSATFRFHNAPSPLEPTEARATEKMADRVSHDNRKYRIQTARRVWVLKSDKEEI